ncbi:MAG: helix-turn-helix domain-containing protein [Acutalibacteraceae bacterium]
MSYKKNDNIVSVMRLQELIDKSGLTREEIANKLNIGASTVTQYRNGKRHLTIEAVIKFADLFNVSADYLLGLTNAKTKDTNIKAVCDYTGLNDEAIQTLHMLKSLSNNFDETIEEIERIKQLKQNNDFEELKASEIEISRLNAGINVSVLLNNLIDDYNSANTIEKKVEFEFTIHKFIHQFFSFYNNIITSVCFERSTNHIANFKYLIFETINHCKLNELNKKNNYKYKNNTFKSAERNEIYLQMYEAKEEFNNAISNYMHYYLSSYEDEIRHYSKTEGATNGNNNEA